MNKFLMAASDVSFDAPQSNEIYFSVTMRMLTTETNLNGVRLTEGFINDIAEHAEEYTCMPLCADTERLSRGQDTGLTHMYDEREEVFKAPQIGSFFEVHKVTDEHGVSLVGTARINKRNADVTEKIIDMYNAGRLKFSFEIWASEIRDEDGVTVVDAAEGNRLTAMAIVTTPALPAAVALNLAADFDVHAFETKVWDLLCREYEGCWRIVWMGIDYSVIQFDECGTMLHVGYKLDGIELVKTEEYEVAFARIDEVNKALDKEMELTAEVTNVETPAVEETTAIVEETIAPAAEAPAPEAPTESAPEAAEEETAETEEAECKEERSEAEEAEVTDEVAELRAELERVKAELEAFKEAERKAELAEKQEKARKYAEREGLNLEAESVKAAIENADYEALAAEVMAKPAENHEDEAYRVVAEMNISSPYGNMFERAN